MSEISRHVMFSAKNETAGMPTRRKLRVGGIGYGEGYRGVMGGGYISPMLGPLRYPFTLYPY